MIREEVIQLVQRYLQDRPMQDNHIEVVEKAVRSDGDWWYVPVRPDHTLPKTYEYYVILSDVESDLKQNEQLDVLLIPSA